MGCYFGKTIDEAQENFSKMVPLSMKGIYKKACKRKSRAAAMKAFCQQCVGWVDVANQIRNCTAWECPMYVYRPYQRKEETDDEVLE